MWWGHPYAFGFCPLVFPFGFFIFVALLFIIVRIIFFRRFRRFRSCGGPMYGPWNQGHDAEDILKRRLANGDITEEDYKHLRDVLKD